MSRFKPSYSEKLNLLNVEITNLVSNGDFSDGTTGWGGSTSTLSAENNILSDTCNGEFYAGAAYQSKSLDSTHKYFLRAKARVTNAVALSLRITMQTFATNIVVEQENPSENEWYTLYGVHTPDESANSVKVYQGYADSATANGKVMEVQEVLAIDLTETFGAGNEPTADEIETLIGIVPENWFDGVYKPTQIVMFNWLLAMIRENTAAIAVLEGS